MIITISSTRQIITVVVVTEITIDPLDRSSACSTVLAGILNRKVHTINTGTLKN